LPDPSNPAFLVTTTTFPCDRILGGDHIERGIGLQSEEIHVAPSLDPQMDQLQEEMQKVVGYVRYVFTLFLLEGVVETLRSLNVSMEHISV
jgi:hypothetical protein